VRQFGIASILVVDDKPDAILGVEVALEPLQQDIMRAGSGREALRHVLRQQFAVILLDINMPGMDGFETAQLIRQHKNGQNTPIIFLTASGDDQHVSRSYSLGAVDFIVTPCNPEVLRTKVGVFVELFRASFRERRQVEIQRARAAQLQNLARASLLISSASSLDGIARAVTESARTVIGAQVAVTSLAPARPDTPPLTVAAASEDHAAARDCALAQAAAIRALARERNGPFRIDLAELAAPSEAEPAARSSERPSLVRLGAPRAALVAPLLELDGGNMGFLLLADKSESEFTEDDEAILVQLSQLGSIAAQNALHASAREANRLKEEFIATLSHELRTPLNAILGWTRILRTAAPDPDKLARGLEVIERNVNAQTRLIEELLDVSRIESGKLAIEARPLALAPLVRTVVDSIRPLADTKGVSVALAMDDGDHGVSGDPERLQQVVGNLLSNAVKFTPRGGRIMVDLRRDREAVELRVSDTGIGIHPDVQPFVFDRFWQAENGSRRRFGGLGIGLAVVRHLVELHGGAVRVESAGLGHGATFTVRLPAQPEPARPGEPAPPTARSAAGGPDLSGVSVLLVEDEPDSRELLREMLERHRAQVTAVGSVVEALDALREACPHVVVSDIAMPGADGFELIRHLRSRGAQGGGQIPALALTAYTRAEDRARTLAAGFSMHASKPIEPAEIVAAVAQLASSGSSAA
jgi:signal transduction histidine kinase